VAWGALAAVWVFILCVQMPTPARPASSYKVAASRPSRLPVTLAERQRELSSLLEGLAPSPSSEPDLPRPRSQRRINQVAT
jgi:hypothetical protein